MIILNDQHAHPAATAQKSNLYKVEVVFRTWQLFQFRVSSVQFSDLHLQLFNEAPYTFLFSFLYVFHLPEQLRLAPLNKLLQCSEDLNTVCHLSFCVLLKEK